VRTNQITKFVVIAGSEWHPGDWEGEDHYQGGGLAQQGD